MTLLMLYRGKITKLLNKTQILPPQYKNKH